MQFLRVFIGPHNIMTVAITTALAKFNLILPQPPYQCLQRDRNFEPCNQILLYIRYKNSPLINICK